MPAAAANPQIEFPTPLEQHWQGLRVLQWRIDETANRALQAEHGISLSEYNALAALVYSDDDGHLRQQFLADSVPLNQSSLSRLVGRLENLGLTERYMCPNDRRGVYTQVTKAGIAMVEAARSTYVGAVREMLGEMADDPVMTRSLSEVVRETD
ncbi:MarR family winged helix-turn-helix transcriptional regulator [Salininema proteolyticum]|uniref:MarR family winged helix-turn-helix transcriptional regulator n=1 Tax=Salininema proteolyticum TaxID=1607685 RepID=A0ABV8TWU0_9ACTN